ncbi:MAG: UDP-N-acetylmuramoyl-L-alanine--D-glutamate ligase [Candidatus Microsaccharimonas sp.]
MKIAIAGYGVEGEENYKYWSTDSSNDITIVDGSETPSRALPEGVKTLLGSDAFEKLNGFDIVVRTAGLAPYKITTDGTMWSATNEFFAQCPAPIIGVTGSKGKGTTSSLITSILEAAGKKVWLVGNIGIPALNVLAQVQPDDIVVYELSSFQLWDIKRSPHTAVVLMIEQEHLDVHRSMEEYVEAKAQITRYQTSSDLLVYNALNEYAQFIADSSNATKIGYPSEAAAHVRDGMFYYGPQIICSTSELRIPGAHNIDNAMAAIDAIWQYVQDPEIIKTGLNNFKGLPHRLAYVDTVNGVEYYDDSIATTPGSAIASLRAFPNRSKVIILGGSYKGSDFSELGNELTRHEVKVLLIGDEGPAIAKAADEAGFSNYEFIENPTTEKFTRRAAELSVEGGVVLLSPASASFGLYKNYVDRGEQFIAAVEKLKTT